MKIPEFQRVLKERIHCTNDDAEMIFRAFIDIIVETVDRGEKIDFREFGTFYPKTIAARRSVNLKTGQPGSIPASVGLAFRASKMRRKVIGGGPAFIPDAGA